MRVNVKQPSLNRGQQKSAERTAIENERAAKIDKLNQLNLTPKEYRQQLQWIYKHLPPQALDYMTEVHFKNL